MLKFNSTANYVEKGRKFQILNLQQFTAYKINGFKKACQPNKNQSLTQIS